MLRRCSRLLGIVALAAFAALLMGAMPVSRASAQAPWYHRHPSRHVYPVITYPSLVYPPYSIYPTAPYSYPFGYGAGYTNSAYAPSSAIAITVSAPSASYGSYPPYGNSTTAGSYGSSGSYGNYGSTGYAGGAVAVAQSPQLGPYLTAGGMTLYVLSNDGPGMSACYGNCVNVWPPLQAPAGGIQAMGGLSGNFSTIMRTDGIQQVAYNGMPLYYFSHDVSPGDTNGQGATDQWGHWTVARP